MVRELFAKQSVAVILRCIGSSPIICVMPTCPSGKGDGLENRLSEMACGFKSYRWRLESLFDRQNYKVNLQGVGLI